MVFRSQVPSCVPHRMLFIVSWRADSDSIVHLVLSSNLRTIHHCD